METTFDRLRPLIIKIYSQSMKKTIDILSHSGMWFESPRPEKF